MEEEDLFRLISLGSGSGSRPSRRQRARAGVAHAGVVAPNELPLVVEEPASSSTARGSSYVVAPGAASAPAAPALPGAESAPAPGESDVLQLASIGNRPGRKGVLYGQREEALCAYARKCKRQKQLESQVAETTATNKTLQGKLDTAAELFPIIAKPLGLERTRKSDWTEYRAIVLQKLATDPLIKGAGLDAFILTQDQAAATMQKAVASLQDNAVNVAFFGRPDTTGNAILPNFNIALRFNSLAWEWDETLQRMMAIKKDRDVGPKPKFKLAYQVMMQNGSMHSYEVDSSGNGGEVLNDPLFTRGFTIDKPDADHIFEGVSRGVPFDLTDVGPGDHGSSSMRNVIFSTSCFAWIELK